MYSVYLYFKLFPGFEGKIFDLIESVPGHCLYFIFQFIRQTCVIFCTFVS